MKKKLKYLCTVVWRGLFASGYYWWRGGHDEPWQVVEVFEQDGKILVGRIARWQCCELNERGGNWGAMIPTPSCSGYLKATALNMLGAALACIEALHALACSRSQTSYQSCNQHTPCLSNQRYLCRLVVADWIGAIAILPFGRFGCKYDQEEIVGQESSCFLANSQAQPPKAG